MSMYSLSTKKIKIYSWLKSFSTTVMAFKRRQSIDHFQSCAIGAEKKRNRGTEPWGHVLHVLAKSSVSSPHSCVKICCAGAPGWYSG